MFKSIVNSVKGVRSAFRNTMSSGIVKSMQSTWNKGFNSSINFLAKNTKDKSVVINTPKPNKILNGIHSVAKHTIPAQVIVGTAAMTSVAMMSGAIGKAEQIMQERYMKDSRYSSRLLANSNVGQARSNSRLSIGNHTGLSLALHKNRH